MYGLELGSVRLPLAPLAPEDEAVVVEGSEDDRGKDQRIIIREIHTEICQGVRTALAYF